VRHEVHLRTSSGRRSIIIDHDFCQALSVPVGVNEESVALFVSSWIALLADSPLQPENKPYSVYRHFIAEMRTRGIKETVLRYSELSHQLVSRHSLMGTGTSIGDWIDEFKDTPVFYEYHHYFSSGDTKIVEFLYTFLNFGKKLEYVDESFNDTAFRGWLGIEEKLSGLTLQDSDTEALRLILRTCLPPFSVDDFRPKFGPGAVMERGVKGRLGKLRNFQYDPLIDRFIFHGHIGMYGYGGDHGLTSTRVIPDPCRWTAATRAALRESRLMFVPKNLKTSRSICMEPSVLMFFQQGIMREMLRMLRHSEYRYFIDILDQSRNRDLALYGSYTSEIDTIDLSAASDSLSLELVKKVFPPSWLIPMIVTRSSRAQLPDGTIVPLLKFAPMGSALCFPTQCIIFASVCIYAACLCTYDTVPYSISFSDWMSSRTILDVCKKFLHTPRYSVRNYQPLTVYGDDICVDRRLTQTVMSILSRLGFSVNDEKSFVGSQSFRESCGGFYLGGHDITPLYFRIKAVRRRIGAEHVASHVHLINECYRRGYKHLYRFLHQSLMTWECRRYLREKGATKNSIPYVTDPSQFGIMVTPNPCGNKNNHMKKRLQPDILGQPWYQREEIRSWTISYARKVDDLELLPVVDSYEYMRWWAGRTAESTLEVNSSIPRYDTGGSGLRWRWIPSE
jgi:hypothetical protein